MTDFEAEQSRQTIEAIRASLLQFRKYGLGFLVSTAFLAMILKGMPWHNLWPALGTITLVGIAFLFGKTVQFGAIALVSWMLQRDFIRKRKAPPHSSADRTITIQTHHRGKWKMKN